ncbi:MAG TPA: thioredoxin domain-containing protein, partial [Bryobacteraceae bacterium]|nr:thioredoxin domain-containing protein [Bryobacteraceae bacterium]
MPVNSLIHEKSPYLLQHAHNPVDWRAWGEDAFRKAREENKPIFLSVGYSTCHWCHVMERESFENERIAEVLNRWFVPIKVDREERPDVDRVYMLFVQASTGSGGWPMSVFLTPELEPFFGGTYFPPERRYGHPGFGEILEGVARTWQTNRAGVTESASDVVRQLRDHSAFGLKTAPAAPEAALDSAFQAFRRTFDSVHGGFGGAPKFPRVSVHDLLLRYFVRTRNPEARDMVLATLDRMARGGLHDHLGGGFHRYSVDERWHVPHFEKMLYDQAQIAISYLEAFQVSGDAAYAAVARRTLDYVLRDMTAPEGGFYSAEDADSALEAADPARKAEGAFYVWTAAEIERIAGQPAAAWFAWHYGVQPDGNVRDDPHGEFSRKNILFGAHTEQETAQQFGRPEAEVRETLEAVRARLLDARAARPRPHLDDKILTAWNGLMISALSKGAGVLADVRYLDAARRAAEFVLTRMYEAGSGTLLRRFRDGEAAIPGFLDDYAFFVQGLLDLYQAGFNLAHLNAATELAAAMIARFEDAEGGGFFASPRGDESLVLRLKDDYDGAEPSGNSIAILDCLRLARIAASTALEGAAARALAAFASRLEAAPVALPRMLVALDYSRTP